MTNPDYTDLPTLEKLTGVIREISEATTERPTDWRGEQASLAFAKVGVTCLTFLRLVPGSTYFSPGAKLAIWDLSAVASQGRNLVEAYHLLFYLIQKPADATEAAFQQLLWEYHEQYERNEMLRAGVPDSLHLPRVAAGLAARRARLEASPVFQRLSPKHCERLIQGKNFKLAGPVELSRAAGISEFFYRSNYKYCSAFAHSAPFSISQLREFEAGSTEAKKLLGTLVSHACGYSAMAIRDALKLFPDQAQAATPAVRQVIKFWEDLLRWEKSPYFTENTPPQS